MSEQAATTACKAYLRLWILHVPQPVKTERDPDPAPVRPIPAAGISAEDEAFLEDLQKRTFQYFWDHTNPKNGLTLDRVATDGTRLPPGHNSHNVASIAASGFALTSFCVAADRGWVPKAQAIERTRNALEFFANRAFHKDGWFYHWMDYETGERRWRSEISTIDTALLMGGVLTAKQCFSDNKEIARLADKISQRIDYPSMQAGDQYLISHGWRPEEGYLNNYWDNYSEQMIIYLLGYWFENASDLAELVVGMGTIVDGIWRIPISGGGIALVHTPVLTRLDRFSQPPRTPSSIC